MKKTEHAESAAAIKAVRKYTGLNQIQFAERYNISVRMLRNWEQGVYKVPTGYLYMLSRLAEIDFPDS